MTLRSDITTLVRLHLTPCPTAELILGYLHSRGLLTDDWLDDDPEMAERLDLATEIAKKYLAIDKLPDPPASN